MSVIRLGRPATRPSRSGPSARPKPEHPENWWQCPIDPCPTCDAMVDDTKHRPWAPNMEEPTQLRCGDTVPWPVVSLLGTHGQQVWCDLHGFQRVTNTEITKARKGMKQCRTTQNPSQSTLPESPPF